MTVRKTPEEKAKPKPAPVPAVPEERLSITQVAMLIGKRYQMTRDLMLSGAFGPAEYDTLHPRAKVTITRAQVTAYLAKPASPVVPKPVL